MTQIANSLQVLERIGGDDETRTRDLCRDRDAGRRNLLELNGTDSPLVSPLRELKGTLWPAYRTLIGPRSAGTTILDFARKKRRSNFRGGRHREFGSGFRSPFLDSFRLADHSGVIARWL